MRELESGPVISGDTTLTEHGVNGVPAESASGRHRGRWALGTGRGEPDESDEPMARLRLLAASVIGVGFLFVAHWLAPEQGSLFAFPSDPVGWLAVICGIAGVWLVPGLWISAVMMRFAVGPVAWLGTRIATTLGWYALIGPFIHDLGQGAKVTTVGILTVTTAATAAVSIGVALGLSTRPAGRWRRFLVAAVVGAVCAQVAIQAAGLMSADDKPYSDNLPLDVVLVLGSALLVAAGTLSHPQLPPRRTAQNMRTPLIALAVIAFTAAALLAVGARWSPAQQMPSAFSAEQNPSPTSADVEFDLTPIGPNGSELIQRADFSAADDTGHPVSVETQLVPADGTADRAKLLVVLQRSSQPVLCTEERMARAATAGLPVKLIMRDQVSGLTLPAVIPFGWCLG